MIAIVHSIYSQSVHAPALNAVKMDKSLSVFEIFIDGSILLNVQES